MTGKKRGTKIFLFMKKDLSKYLRERKIKEIINIMTIKYPIMFQRQEERMEKSNKN